MRSKFTSIAAGLLLLAGCHTATVPHPLAKEYFGNDANAQMEFWHTLADRKLTTNDEAFHGLLLYFDGNDPAKDYSDRVSRLKAKEMLAASFNEPANSAVTRGTLSIAIAHGLSVHGGVMYHLTRGRSERYATKELQAEGVYPVSSPNQVFSGPEFVGIIGKLDDYQHGVAQPITNRLNEQ